MGRKRGLATKRVRIGAKLNYVRPNPNMQELATFTQPALQLTKETQCLSQSN